MLRSVLFVFAAAAFAVPAAAASAAHTPKRVFLTFDDGPIDITLTILDVLKAQGVKATFFVNAVHLEGAGGENEARAHEALRRVIEEGHVLGNHSLDHMAHNRPPGVYSVTASSAYGAIETDLPYFVPRNVNSVNQALGPLASRSNNQVATFGRLPYSNVWMFGGIDRVCTWCDSGGEAYWHPKARERAERETSAAAGSLAKTLYTDFGMSSFGWDVHWMPTDWTAARGNETLPPAADVEREVVALLDHGRHCATIQGAERCQRPVREGHVVILVHDFLFENGPRGRGEDKNIPQLISLISSLKSRGYVFATMDHYLD